MKDPRTDNILYSHLSIVITGNIHILIIVRIHSYNRVVYSLLSIDECAILLRRDEKTTVYRS